ncbi:DMT family transporter [Inquilinus sp. YAF38]|uniref:DMT family transporter n=1 Tax=Inquilinus sp. YAF38 TaxID=3233084 RepID=UPI003F92694C
MMRPVDLLLTLGVMLIWGYNFVIAKYGLAELPPLLFMALRFGLVALLLVPFVRMPRGRWRDVLILAVMLGLTHFSLMFTGLAHVDAAVAAIVIQVQVPASAFLAMLLFGDRIGWRRALGMAVAIGGVAILAGEPRHGSALWAIGLIVMAAIVWAGANIQMKRMTDLDPSTINGWMSLFAAPMLLCASLLIENGQWQAVTRASGWAWMAVAFQAVIVVIFSYAIWYRLLRTYSVNQTMPYTLLVPVFGVLSGVLFLGEPASWSLLLGGIATLIGVGIIILRRPKAVEAQAQVT